MASVVDINEIRPISHAGFYFILENIDDLLAEGHLGSKTVGLLSKAERQAITQIERNDLYDRILLHGILTGQFDACDRLFGERLQQEADDNLRRSHSAFRRIAGWTQPNNDVTASEAEVAITILEELALINKDRNPLLHLDTLASLVWKKSATSSIIRVIS